MKPTFDIDALRMIVAGAELGSFARAAVQLGRSQSAISMQLKRLEEQAGRPLFQRNGRGLVPTEAGDATNSMVTSRFGSTASRMTAGPSLASALPMPTARQNTS